MQLKNFLVLTIIFFSFLSGMEQVNAPITAFPAEIWENIFYWLNKDLESKWFHEKETEATLLKKLEEIRKIIPIAKSCKKLHAIGTCKVANILTRMQALMQKEEGVQKLLYYATKKELLDYVAKRLVQVGCKLGGDLDKASYTAPNVIVKSQCGKETLLTLAVKQNDYEMTKRLLELGANPMQPNTQGEIPIDLATTVIRKSPLKIARMLKENGGDPENRYIYWGEEDVCGAGKYGYEYGHRLLKEKNKQSGANPCIEMIDWLFVRDVVYGFSGGCIIGGLLGVAWSTLEKYYKKAKKDQAHS